MQSVRQGAGIFAGLAPWIVYWILIGNVDFRLALLISLVVAAVQGYRALQGGTTPNVLDVGTIAAFGILTIVAYTTNDAFLERWIQPLANGALFLIALASILVGKPFVLPYAQAEVPPEVQQSRGFIHTVNVITWVWTGVFGVMTLSALIPPIVDGDATFLDQDDTLGIICYWVIPIAALAFGILFSKWYPERARERARRAATA
jgi:hypothetical protein